MTADRIKPNNRGRGAGSQLVFALDQDPDEAERWIQRLRSRVWGFKLGSILYQKRPDLVEMIKSLGCGCFLDLKFHDIPHTVSGAVRAAFGRGVDLVTLHALGGSDMIREAAQHQNDRQKILAVTVLTSHDHSDLRELGFECGVRDLASKLAGLAVGAGASGFVCSVEELKTLKAEFPSATALVPGLRLDSESQDQKRTGTYREASDLGADFLVLGRDLYLDKDWESKWEKIISSLGVVSSKLRS